MSDSVTRFVITRMGRHGLRCMVGANEPRNTYATEGAALRAMNELLENPDNDIPGVFGAAAVGTFEVRPVECWSNHQPKTRYFDC